MFECGAIGIGACIKDLSGYVPNFGIAKENIITKRNVFDAFFFFYLNGECV